MEEFVGCGPHPDIKIETSSAAHAIIVRIMIGLLLNSFEKQNWGLWELRLRKLGSALESRNHKMHGAAALSQGSSLESRRLRAR
jgi:hypothetical protein